jgi:hypothetical protein
LLLGGFALIGRSGHCCFRSEFIESASSFEGLVLSAFYLIAPT